MAGLGFNNRQPKREGMGQGRRMMPTAGLGIAGRGMDDAQMREPYMRPERPSRGTALPYDPANASRGTPLGYPEPYMQEENPSRGEALPYDPADAREAEPLPYDEGGDGLGPREGWEWSKEEQAFLDAVDNDEEFSLYEDMDAWKQKWMQKASEFGLSPESAMRVLDSVADFDQGGGYE